MPVNIQKLNSGMIKAVAVNPLKVDKNYLDQMLKRNGYARISLNWSRHPLGDYRSKNWSCLVVEYEDEMSRHKKEIEMAERRMKAEMKSRARGKPARKLAREFVDKIESGEMPYGSKFPSFTRYVESEKKCSSRVFAAARSILIADGYISIHPLYSCQGTFVTWEGPKK